MDFALIGTILVVVFVLAAIQPRFVDEIQEVARQAESPAEDTPTSSNDAPKQLSHPSTRAA